MRYCGVTRAIRARVSIQTRSARSSTKAWLVVTAVLLVGVLASGAQAQVDEFSGTAPNAQETSVSDSYIVTFSAGTSDSAARDLLVFRRCHCRFAHRPPSHVFRHRFRARPHPPLAALEADASVSRVDADQDRAVATVSQRPELRRPVGAPPHRLGGRTRRRHADRLRDRRHPRHRRRRLAPRPRRQPRRRARRSSPAADRPRDPNGHGTAMAGIVAAETDNVRGHRGRRLRRRQGHARHRPRRRRHRPGQRHHRGRRLGSRPRRRRHPHVLLEPGLLGSRCRPRSTTRGRRTSCSSRRPATAARASRPSRPATAASIGVSSTDLADALSSASNYGAAAFLAAPGEGVLSTSAGGGYATVTGTSASAAIVAGVGRAAARLVRRRLERRHRVAARAERRGGRRPRRRPATAASTSTARSSTRRATRSSPRAPHRSAAAGRSSGPTSRRPSMQLFRASPVSLSAAPAQGTGPARGFRLLQNWRELDLIPSRVALTKTGAASPQTRTIVVDFDHTKSPGSNLFVGIENLINFTPSANVTITSGPTLSAPPGADTWSYTFDVSMTGGNNATGFVEFRARLAAGAHFFTGSSLAMGGVHH